MKKVISIVLAVMLIILSVSAAAVVSAGAADVLYVNCDGKKYQVNVGDTFTCTYYLNVTEATKGCEYQGYSTEGMIANIDTHVLFDHDYLSIEFDPTTDEEKCWPILSKTGLTYNVNHENGCYFNALTVGYQYKFNSDDCVLFSLTFKAEQAGETDLDPQILYMCCQDEAMTKIVNKYEAVLPFYSLIAVDAEEVEETDETETETETEAETETETTSESSGYVKIDGKLYPVSAGDTFTVTQYLNVSDITKDSATPGHISSIDARILYDTDLFTVTNYSSSDTSDIFPNLQSGSSMSALVDGEGIYYNATSADDVYTFNSDTSVLYKAVFRVKKDFEGTETISGPIMTLGYTVGNSIVTVIDDFEVVDESKTPSESITVSDIEADPLSDYLIVTADDDTAKVKVGDTFQYTFYLNVNEATQGCTFDGVNTQGYVANNDTHIRFDRDYLSVVFDPTTDEEKCWPILSKSGLTYNVNHAEGIVFNGATTGYQYKFNSDDCVLCTFTFKAEQAGVTEIESLIKTMSCQDDDLTNIVNNYKTLKDIYTEIVLEAPEYDSYVLGDANADGEVDANDVTIMQKLLADYTVDTFDSKAADVNADGEVDSTDITNIQKYLTDYTVPYKIGEKVS